MKEIKKDIISIYEFEEDNRCNKPDSSDGCAAIRIECDTVNVNINFR